MKILVIGSGGREHAIAWKLNQSQLVSQIFCAPGNAGTGKIGKNLDIPSDNIDKLVKFSLENNIDLTVVGPEGPLVEGIVNIFRKNGLKIIGPDKYTSQLEGSKSFAKKFMDKYNIPTAKYNEVTTFKNAKLLIDKYSYPVVIKADGLAAGKGVFICENKDESLSIIKELLDNEKLGDAGNKIVIEEFLEGIETSILCFIDGNTIVPMVSSQDHKRAFDDDKGPNTGGMGTYSPNYIYTEEIEKMVEEKILKSTLKGIREEKMDYKGIIFIGVMVTKEGPKVLEYNVRFGDPETQVILPRLKTDLIEVFNNILDEKLETTNIQWSDEHSVCVILASGGYPNKYEKRMEIKGLEDIIDDNLLIFHSGTIENENNIVTNGGRVIGLVGIGKNTVNARKKVYENIDKIKFKESFYRKDIGLK